MPNVFEVFEDIPPAEQNPTLQMLYDYEKHYLELIRKYRAEIEFIDGLHVSHAREVNKFYRKDLPAIQEKLSKEPIDAATKNEWLKHLEEHISKSFYMSRCFIEILTTKKLEEFDCALREKIRGES